MACFLRSAFNTILLFTSCVIVLSLAAAEQNSSASHGVRKSLQRVADVKRKNAITKVGAAITRSKTVALASRKRISMRVGGPTVGGVTFVPPPYPLPTGKIQLPALYFTNCEF